MTQAQLTKKLSRLEKEVLQMRQEIALVSKPTFEQRQIILKRTAGALKHRIKGDLVAWQRRIRAEWDR